MLLCMADHFLLALPGTRVFYCALNNMDHGQMSRVVFVCTLLAGMATFLFWWLRASRDKHRPLVKDPTAGGLGEVLSDEGLDGLVRSPRRGTHVLFVAQWCPFCKTVSEVIRERTKERGSVPPDFRVYLAQVEDVPLAVRRHEITQVPSLLSVDTEGMSPVSIPDAFQRLGW